jgi:hypothetical protein
MWSIAFINDSLLAGGAAWFCSEDEPLSRAVIFDTLGTIKDSITLLNNGWLATTAVTHDGKLLFYNTIEENGDFDTFLFKLTQDLEQDTFYTRPFVYDSLCPNQIVSDTIVPDDCGVIVGIEEETGRPGDGETGGQGEEGKKGALEIWPNPAAEEIHVRWNMDDGRFYRDCELVIYDVFGRAVTASILSSPQVGGGREGGLNGEGEVTWQVDVSALPAGIYLAVVKDERDVMRSAKFIIAR